MINSEMAADEQRRWVEGVFRPNHPNQELEYLFCVCAAKVIARHDPDMGMMFSGHDGEGQFVGLFLLDRKLAIQVRLLGDGGNTVLFRSGAELLLDEIERTAEYQIPHADADAERIALNGFADWLRLEMTKALRAATIKGRRPDGSWLSRAMRKAGISQSELSERAGLNPEVLADVEAGMFGPLPDEVKRIAVAIGLKDVCHVRPPGQLNWLVTGWRLPLRIDAQSAE
jgi:Helix-turn-helix